MKKWKAILKQSPICKNRFFPNAQIALHRRCFYAAFQFNDACVTKHSKKIHSSSNFVIVEWPRRLLWRTIDRSLTVRLISYGSSLSHTNPFIHLQNILYLPWPCWKPTWTAKSSKLCWWLGLVTILHFRHRTKYPSKYVHSYKCEDVQDSCL